MAQAGWPSWQLYLLLLCAVAAAAAVAAADEEEQVDESYVLPPEQQEQCFSGGSSDEVSAGMQFPPKFCIADEGSTHHLGNVLDVLSLLGYTETQTPADANLVWAWRDPFFRPADAAAARKLTATHEHLRNLQRYQFVNQLPGQGFLATKPELAKLSARLPRLPRTFQLPQEYKAFKEYVSSDARGRRMEWLQKDPEHRGISILSDPTASALADIRQPVLLQQLVRPMLIQKRLWDVGLYVAVTSLEPLLAYVHTGGVLLRFCSREYVRNITDDTPSNSYVISGLDDYTPAREIEALKPHFGEGAADTLGTTLALAALRSYMDSAGIDSQRWWLEMQATILQVLQLTAPKMREQQAHLYTGQRINFFTLLRFDFMLDEAGDSYLIEVNMSPGLFRPDAPLDQQLLSRTLVHDLLALKGLAPGGINHQFSPPGLLDLTHHPDAIALGEPACAGNCSTAAQCNTDARCRLCRGCRSEWQNDVLRRVAGEHRSSHGFMRVSPPHSSLAQFMADTGAERFAEVEGREDDAIVAAWLEAKCRTDFRWC